MKRNNIFWGGALVGLGVLFLLQKLGVLTNVGDFIWPLFLLLLGIWMVLGVYWRGENESISLDLQNAKSVNYRFSHGAGQIEIKGGAPSGKALVGSVSAGMSSTSRLDGDTLNVKVDAAASFLPFVGTADGVYHFQLTQEVPVSIRLDMGASQLDIDLHDVNAERIKLNTGASSSNVTLPARNSSLLDLEAGAASINIIVPEGVAGRIRIKEGLTALNVDTQRFPRLDNRYFQSPDFESATIRTEINVEAGLGAININ